MYLCPSLATHKCGSDTVSMCCVCDVIGKTERYSVYACMDQSGLSVQMSFVI